MISFNRLVELVFAVIELFADGSARESPQSCVTSDLVLVRNELNGF